MSLKLQYVQQNYYFLIINLGHLISLSCFFTHKIVDVQNTCILYSVYVLYYYYYYYYYV